MAGRPPGRPSRNQDQIHPPSPNRRSCDAARPGGGAAHREVVEHVAHPASLARIHRSSAADRRADERSPGRRRARIRGEPGGDSGVGLRSRNSARPPSSSHQSRATHQPSATIWGWLMPTRRRSPDPAPAHADRRDRARGARAGEWPRVTCLSGARIGGGAGFGRRCLGSAAPAAGVGAGPTAAPAAISRSRRSISARTSALVSRAPDRPAGADDVRAAGGADLRCRADCGPHPESRMSPRSCAPTRRKPSARRSAPGSCRWSSATPTIDSSPARAGGSIRAL